MGKLAVRAYLSSLVHESSDLGVCKGRMFVAKIGVTTLSALLPFAGP